METDPTAGKHRLTFMNATQMALGDDSSEGIIYEYTYTLANDILTVTRPDGGSTAHAFQIVNANTIKVTGIGFYVQPANELPIVVTFVKD